LRGSAQEWNKLRQLLASNLAHLQNCVDLGALPNFDCTGITFDDNSAESNSFSSSGWHAVAKTVLTKNPHKNTIAKMLSKRLDERKKEEELRKKITTMS